ncbi:Holliday junction resolvase RecU [Salicibibacter kimchii]|uniref:Holliday junction resolvase RecU n=2 Tax=Salicibibacter kimchii TaxID=2099786 RepID=A0A345C3K9_9BACI|nr:Holliday junction resolvase RecU [Salicibibacter kimchii]
MATSEYQKQVGRGNRGMALESKIDHTNSLYALKNIALVNKRATPVKVTRSKGTKVISGFFEAKSTVDYDGTYKGRSVAFEAKSLKGKSFPLSMIADHQFRYLYNAQDHGAKAFLIVEFRDTDETFLTPFSVIEYYQRRAEKGGRKSIPLEDFSIHGFWVDRGRGVQMDYLAQLDRWIDKEG